MLANGLTTLWRVSPPGRERCHVRIEINGDLLKNLRIDRNELGATTEKDVVWDEYTQETIDNQGRDLAVKSYEERPLAVRYRRYSYIHTTHAVTSEGEDGMLPLDFSAVTVPDPLADYEWIADIRIKSVDAH